MMSSTFKDGVTYVGVSIARTSGWDGVMAPMFNALGDGRVKTSGQNVNQHEFSFFILFFYHYGSEKARSQVVFKGVLIQCGMFI